MRKEELLQKQLINHRNELDNLYISPGLYDRLEIVIKNIKIYNDRPNKNGVHTRVKPSTLIKLIPHIVSFLDIITSNRPYIKSKNHDCKRPEDWDYFYNSFKVWYYKNSSTSNLKKVGYVPFSTTGARAIYGGRNFDRMIKILTFEFVDHYGKKHPPIVKKLNLQASYRPTMYQTNPFWFRQRKTKHVELPPELKKKLLESFEDVVMKYGIGNDVIFNEIEGIKSLKNLPSVDTVKEYLYKKHLHRPYPKKKIKKLTEKHIDVWLKKYEAFLSDIEAEYLSVRCRYLSSYDRHYHVLQGLPSPICDLLMHLNNRIQLDVNSIHPTILIETFLNNIDLKGFKLSTRAFITPYAGDIPQEEREFLERLLSHDEGVKVALAEAMGIPSNDTKEIQRIKKNFLCMFNCEIQLSHYYKSYQFIQKHAPTFIEWLEDAKKSIVGYKKISNYCLAVEGHIMDKCMLTIIDEKMSDYVNTKHDALFVCDNGNVAKISAVCDGILKDHGLRTIFKIEPFKAPSTAEITQPTQSVTLVSPIHKEPKSEPIQEKPKPKRLPSPPPPINLTPPKYKPKSKIKDFVEKSEVETNEVKSQDNFGGFPESSKPIDRNNLIKKLQSLCNIKNVDLFFSKFEDDELQKVYESRLRDPKLEKRIDDYLYSVSPAISDDEIADVANYYFFREIKKNELLAIG